MLTGERALARPDEIVTLLVRAGCPPTQLVTKEEDLEAYFLRLTGQEGTP